MNLQYGTIPTGLIIAVATSFLGCGGSSEPSDDGETLPGRQLYRPLTADALAPHGLHAAGGEELPMVTAGAQWRRRIIQWYGAADGDGKVLDELLADLPATDLPTLLTFRSNHPDQSTVSFVPGEFVYDAPSSPPRDIEIWERYVTDVVTAASQGSLVAVQLENEIGQFEVDDATAALYADRSEAEATEYVALLAATARAVRAVDPDIPIITVGMTSVQRFAFIGGLSDADHIYIGVCGDNGASTIQQVSVEQAAGALTQEGERFADKIRYILENAVEHYDYADVHLYSNNEADVVSSARWIEAIWQESGNRRGLVSLEFGLPFHVYSEDYHRAMIVNSRLAAYHAGFDAIAWSSWNVTTGWPVNYQRTSLTGGDGRPRQELVAAYATLATTAATFDRVEDLGGGEYAFHGAGESVVLETEPATVPDVHCNLPW